MQFLVKEFTRTVSFTYEDIIKKQRFCLFFFFSFCIVVLFFAIFNVIERSKVYKVNALPSDAS